MANTKIPSELSSTPSISDSGNATAISIDSSERVGLLTSSPNARLQILNPSNQQTVPAAGAGAGNGVIISNDTNLYGLYLGSIGTGTGYIQQQRNDSATYYDLALQPNGGNVGIGTSSANQDGFDANAKVLTIKSANNGEGVLELIGGGNQQGDTIGVLNFMSQAATSPATQIVTERWNADDEGSMVFKTSSGERMRIPANNKHLYIGFSGTEAPSTVLDGTGAAGCVYIGDSSNSYPVLALESNHSKWLAAYIASDGRLQTYNSVTNRAVVEQSANGEVTMPYQPAFDVSHAGNVTQGNTQTFGTVYVNKGSHYSTSNGRFTAPIAGTYLFYTSYIKNGSLSVHRRGFIKNGVTSTMMHDGRQLRLDQDSSGGQQYGDNGALIAMVTLSVNDYIQVYQQAGNSYGSKEYEYFGGYLIG